MRGITIAVAGAATALIAPAAAQEITTASDSARFALDSGLLLAAALSAIIVLTGFCMRDVGLARARNAPAVCLRTIAIFAISIIAFWLIGYNLIYAIESDGFLGDLKIWTPQDDDPVLRGHADGAFWLFQAMLAALAAAVISSAISERVRFWPFVFFIAVFCGLIYPIVASWVWGGGYLATSWRFYDYGGGAVIHITAGAAALAAAMIVGPRPGKYGEGTTRPAPATELALTAFGVGLILAGWLVILASMGRSFSSIEAVISVAAVIVNAVIAAAGGVLAALFLTQTVYRRAGLVTVLCGAMGGLVSISADPFHPALWQAAMIGAVGGVIVTVAPPFLDRYRVDDAGFVIPAHLLCGLWGVIIVPWSNPDAWILGQAVGAAGIAGFSFLMGVLLWVALRYTIGVRLAPPSDP